MYNLKIEAEGIIRKLQENGFEAYFVGNYPFVKKNNPLNPANKLKIKSIDIITNARLEDIKKLFEIVKPNTEYYNKYALVELLIKQNKVNFKVYHAATYTNIVTGKTKEVNTVEDILNEFSFLIDSIRIDIEGNVINYSNKKSSAIDSISTRTLLSNGNFRERLLENPMIIFDLCLHASNIPYTINNSYLKIIGNNKNYIKHIKLEVIQKYLDRILISKNAYVGLMIIRNNLLDFSYNGKQIFQFLKYCTDQDLLKFAKFNSSVDIISRWTFLFNHVPKDEQQQMLDDLNLTYKNKIMWLLNNYNLIEENDNYKLAIYNSKQTLVNISESKNNVFLLYDMFQKLTSIWKSLDESKTEICNMIIDVICSRPFFDYQIAYNDEEIHKLLELDESICLKDAKEEFLKALIMQPKHPNEDDYLELLKETILSYINNPM